MASAVFSPSALEGKLALVSGSTSGIGKAIAQRLLGAGAHVIINGRNQDRLDGAMDELRRELPEGHGERVHGVTADLSRATGADAVFAAVEAIGRPLNILVCNTGIFETKDFFSTTDEDWQKYHDVNIMSTVRLARKYLKEMLERDEGRIIIVASEAGVKPIPQLLALSASKASQLAIARGLAELTKGTNVRVNSLLPGPTATPGVQTYMETMAAERGLTAEVVERQYFAEHEPTSLLGRLLRPEEVADVALFLASPASAAVNGASQRAEGGSIRRVDTCKEAPSSADASVVTHPSQ